MRLAVLPARGGSRRVPRKNIRPFCGRPMIAWAIEAARASGAFDRIIVSTDDEEIAETARSEGAEVPFLRPADLADDYTGTTDVIAHATEWAEARGWAPEAVCCLYPTAPMVSPADLVAALDRLREGWSYVFTATDFAAPVQRGFLKTANGGVEMLFPEYFSTRSQDLPQTLHDAAQFYWGVPSAWTERRQIFAPHSSPLIVPRWRVQDIDTPEDWHRAEALFRALGGA